MNPPANINLHIERVVIDEAVHRAGPEAVRAALADQLPALLAAGGVSHFQSAANAAATGLAAQVPTSAHPRKP